MKLSNLVTADIDGLPPSVNRIWRANYGGRKTYKSTEAKEWQDLAIAILEREKKSDGVFLGKTHLKLDIITRTNRRMDIDNRVKAIQDCLAPAGIIKDDSQIWKLSVQRVKGDRDATRAELTIIKEEEE